MRSDGGGARLIELNGLTRRFNGHTVVDDLSATVAEGSLFGFLGRNGAGKTTTLKMLSTVLRPTRGTARIGGYDIVSEAVEVRKLIGVVGEDVETTRPFWTPLEYLRYFLGLHSISRSQANIEARRWLERLELEDHRHRRIGEFSSGMKKRLELCRALSHQPQVLLLDEPTKELDIPGKREIWDLLKGLVSAESLTVFLCSHDAAEIEALCEDVGVVRLGSLTFTGILEALPDNVIRVVTGQRETVASILQSRLPLISHSMVGNSLYMAFDAGVSLGDVRSEIEARGISFSDIQEARSFDERILVLL